MVVLETASALLGGPYAQGAPALKMVQKRYIGLHQWLGPIRKELKEHIVSVPKKKKNKKKLRKNIYLKQQ
ncbi:GH15268 [Drosophila grimshawi]|uniref:GH15268 n=1 Tax=Drosophila grimshawi TaxID=7222 RepID=B4JUQ7_DROGR|nr:GH15268 [Drosophila grimshawi]